MTEADIDEHDEIRHTALNRRARRIWWGTRPGGRRQLEPICSHWPSMNTWVSAIPSPVYPPFGAGRWSAAPIRSGWRRSANPGGILRSECGWWRWSDAKISDIEDFVERREEFKRIIDKNHDGKADRGELLNYVNPKTPRYALQEAATLFSLCDENKDELLTLKEVMKCNRFNKIFIII